MPTHAELASKLLFDAAEFFLTLGEQNPPLMDQMQENADVFRQMAAILAEQPQGQLSGTPIAELGGKLLKDAATFFTTLASQNPPIKQQMMENATVFHQIGELVTQNPLGILE
jgi:hypothetical protein